MPLPRSQITLRLATIEDAPPLRELLTLCFGEDIQKLAREFVHQATSTDAMHPTFCLAFKEDILVGTGAFVEEVFSPDVWGLSWICTHPDHRNEGIGSAIVKALLTEINQQTHKTTTVILNTLPNKISLYEKFGFIPAAHGHKDGILMLKMLESRINSLPK